MPSHVRASPATALALNTYIKLIRASTLVERRMTAQMAKHGLTWSQFGVLEALHHLGPMAQKDLAKRILRSPGDLSTILDNLGKQGLVTREQDEKDRRRRVVRLTDEGRVLISEVFPEHAEEIREALSVLSPQEQAMLGCLSRKLGTSLAEDGEWQGGSTIDTTDCRPPT